MTRKYRRTNAGAARLFKVGQYQTFKKGDLYRDPRINQGNGTSKDFLMMTAAPEDIDFLEKYLKGELDNYPSEPYNTFTTGTDKNGESLVALYWTDGQMEQTKVAVILCRNGCEEEVLHVVDECCKEAGGERYDNAPVVMTKKEAVGKIGLPSSLDKYKSA